MSAFFNWLQLISGLACLQIGVFYILIIFATYFYDEKKED